MANTYVDYTATAAQTDFAFNFNYLEDSHVVVEIDGIDKTLTTDYTIVTSPSKKVVLTSGATAGQLVRVKRVSDFGTDLVDFVNGSVLNEADLDKAYQHNRYLNEEAAEGNNDSMQTVGGGTDFNAESKKIVNLATPTLSTDATNKNYVDDRVALGSTNLNAFDKSTHTGDNTNTEFTLSFTSQSDTAEAYIVTIDGVVQTPTTAYSVNTTTNKIIFTSAPPTSANIVVVPIGTTSSASDATVVATGSTTARTLADRFGEVVNVLDFGADNTGATDASEKIQEAIDYAKSIATKNEGNQYDASKAAKITVDFGSGHYLIKKPIDCQSNSTNKANGISLIGGNALIEMATVANGWTDATRVDTSAGATVQVKACLIFGVEDYATAGGSFSTYNSVRGINFKGNGQASAKGIYADVVSGMTITDCAFQDFGYAIYGKVIFLSTFKTILCNAVASAIYIKNTSVADGYVGGIGIEGGGITIQDIKAFNDFANNTDPRFYFYKCGELNINGMISFGGLGKGLVIERLATDPATGTKWNNINNVEIAECADRAFDISYCSKITFSNLLFVKVGNTLNGLTAAKLLNCSEVTISNFVWDNYIDIANTPGIQWKIENCTSVRVSDGAILAVPNTNGETAIVRLVNSIRSRFVNVNFGNTSESGKKFNYIISSDSNCQNTGVVACGCLTGTVIIDWEDLQGAGDYYRSVITLSGSNPTTDSNFIRGSSTYNPPLLNAGDSVTTTVTVTGAALGDFANASFASDSQGLLLTSWVSAADTATVLFKNNTTGSVNLSAATLRVLVTKA